MKGVSYLVAGCQPLTPDQVDGEGLWRPTMLEIFVMNRDGINLRQVTRLGGANFAPAWHPDGKRIIFASNARDPKGRDFDVFLVNLDGA